MSKPIKLSDLGPNIAYYMMMMLVTLGLLILAATFILGPLYDVIYR